MKLGFAQLTTSKLCVFLFLVVWIIILFASYTRIDTGVFRTSGSDCDTYREQLEALESNVFHLYGVSGHRKTDFKKALPLIYVVTPTYSRLIQKAELTRFSHTLKLVPNVVWILVEDADHKSEMIGRLLIDSGLRYAHLNAPTRPAYKLDDDEPNWSKPRGVDQRNTALSWLRRSFENGTIRSSDGVVYFADDDNTYDLRLFKEIRSTKVVSVFPVGLVGGLMWEGPKVNNGKVIGWVTAWKPNRPFPIDMAGFAVNLRTVLKNPVAKFHADRPRGFVESSFLESITSVDQLEPKAENCTKVFVWHTRTEKYKLNKLTKLQKLNLESVLETKVEV